MRDYFGEEHFLNIATFKTETSRSAILTCCRGMDIPLEIAQEIVDTIPVVRGVNYSINDCLYGGEEKEPSPLFKKAIESHPGLLEACLKIEGLISGVGIHASGVAITNDSYVKQTSCMRAPNGTLITAFDLGDCEKVGIIKYDLLTVSTLDEIRTTLNLLLKDGLIEDKGSLRATYNAYLHPDVLDYTTPEMFALLGTNKATNIFQLSTNMSMQACKMLHPKSLMEMTLVNSVIRLAGEHGKESPTDKYVRYKNNPEEWYKDLRDYGLNENEIKILERHLKDSSGLCLSQETLMLMSMDKEISGMTLAESDTLRKAISKKKHKLVVQSKETFYKRGMENDVRKIFLDYVWEEQFSLSLSYSFALSHGVAYSCIGLQQLNLLYHYPAIYSQCATLLVNSSSSEDSVGSKIDYGKIASAASFAQRQGIRFAPPDINKADRGFTPDAKNNIIYCGLKNISAINEEKTSAIIENRNTGYTSLHDFLSKNDITKIQMISLIKAGAFDNLYKGYSRQKILQGYVSRLVNETIEDKTSLSASNIDNILSMNLLPEEYKIYGRYYNFNKFITQKNFVAEKINNRVWLIAKDIAVPFFEQHYLSGLQEKKEYFYTAEGIMFSKSAYTRLYKAKMEKVLTFINTPDFLRKYNLAVKNATFHSIWDKYCQGTIEDWEFDSLKFYIGNSPLKKINSQKYNISSFDTLPEKPVVEEEFQWKGQTCYKYRTSRICGTVLDCNRTKHLVTLLTPEKEVVEVKFYAGAFIHYNKVIKETSSSGETICDNSWFTRGNKLMIAGYRSGDMFRPKKYKDGIYRHTVALIDSIDQTGNVVLRELRLGEKENEWSGY